MNNKGIVPMNAYCKVMVAIILYMVLVMTYRIKFNNISEKFQLKNNPPYWFNIMV